ncbi:MAG: hypothetical protein MUO62_02830, partial [Anaerolineales bacterium]|nr:hypothetical protein [Anaerolineales bacterium]
YHLYLAFFRSLGLSLVTGICIPIDHYSLKALTFPYEAKYLHERRVSLMNASVQPDRYYKTKGRNSGSNWRWMKQDPHQAGGMLVHQDDQILKMPGLDGVERSYLHEDVGLIPLPGRLNRKTPQLSLSNPDTSVNAGTDIRRKEPGAKPGSRS